MVNKFHLLEQRSAQEKGEGPKREFSLAHTCIENEFILLVC